MGNSLDRTRLSDRRQVDQNILWPFYHIDIVRSSPQYAHFGGLGQAMRSPEFLLGAEDRVNETMLVGAIRLAGLTLTR